MAAVLSILQAGFATAIVAPVAIIDLPRRAEPTAAVRALDAAGVPRTFAPTTFRFQCLVGSNGRLGDCIPAEDGGTHDLAAYRARLASLPGIADDAPLRRAARRRLASYRLEETESATRVARSVLIDETVAPTDFAPLPPAIPVAPGEITIVTAPASDDYPSAARRAGAVSRVSATCRVLADLSLLCRDARTDLPALTGDLPLWRVPELDPLFERQTIETLATVKVAPTLRSGGDSVGRETRLSMNWQMP